MTFDQLSAIELASQVQSGQVSVKQVAEHFLSRCEDNADLNAIVHLDREQVFAQADQLDRAKQSGQELGALAGVPIIVKDAICTRGLGTTAGSKMLWKKASPTPEGWRPPYDATVIERLRQAGALILAKANMDEFAMGSSNETSAYGPVKNPWDKRRVPGGSSGGSAASVAAGLAPVALGSDTGGSIRQPAALCGLVGVKPSYGRVSRYGLIAFASSLDQIGPMTPDVRSSARLLEIMAGWDEKDSTSSTLPVGRYEDACSQDLAGLRIGIAEEYLGEGLDPQIRERVEKIVAALQARGCTICPLRMPHTEYGVATYYVLATAEASSNLSRLDGIRFGHRADEAGANLAQLYARSRGEGMGAEVKRRILLGTYALSAGYYDAYYGKAQRVRTLIRRDFDAAFTQVDAMITPTSPTPAFLAGERTRDPLAMYMADVYTLPASLAGIPGISVPAGTIQVEGTELPVGVQVLSPLFAEETLFRTAAGIEEIVSSW